MKRTDMFDFAGVEFKGNGLNNNINHNALPKHSETRDLVKRWKVRQIAERIYEYIRTEWRVKNV
jgi:hypothetical protein